MLNSNVISSKIRIRQLRCFVLVARKKSFVLAAEAIGLTQPAVSRSVKELEQIIGYDLFDRSQRGAHLTVRGRALLDAAELGLMQITQGVMAATETGSDNETIRIGALPNVCSQFLPGVVHAFKTEHPNTTVEIVPGTNLSLLEGLRRGETDLVLGRLSDSDDMRGLVFEPIYDEPLVFVVRAGHPLANNAATLEQALSFPLILPPEGTIIRREAARFLSGQGASKLSNTIETTSTDFQRSYLQISDCVVVVPRGVVLKDLQSGNVVQLPIQDPSLTGPVGMTTNPEAGMNQGLSLFMSEVRENALIYQN